MTRTWLPDRGWTGDWELPALLRAPITERERGALVALSCAGMGPGQIAKNLAKAERIDDVAGDFASGWRGALAGLQRVEARAIVASDEEYPINLASIDAPPPLVYVRGESLRELRPGVAIVGARACSAGAARFARRLGAAFGSAGFVVVSGLARGIDIAAHRGALETGRTIAVLGTGIDVCYPSEHVDVARAIADGGALVTEFPPGLGPRAWHFPARNRIISGLAMAMIVVEAGMASGALITAGFALDQGREIFACTTGPENPAGAGVRELLKDGARLIVDVDQAVADVAEVAGDQGYEIATTKTRRNDAVVAHLSGDSRAVFDAITDATTTDYIATTTGLPPNRVATALVELELEGLVCGEQGFWQRA